MQNTKQKTNRVKGFTLMEMIVVIAIIGILAGILAPTMITYYRKSKIRDANADAKLICNAAQTEIQKFMQMDRAETTPSLFSGTAVISYTPEAGIEYTTVVGNSLAAPADATPDQTNCTNMVNAVNRTVSDGDAIAWAVYVQNYIVKASISASHSSSVYIGEFSSRKSDGTKTDATEMSSQTFDEFMATGLNIQSIATEYYDEVVETEPTT